MYNSENEPIFGFDVGSERCLVGQYKSQKNIYSKNGEKLPSTHAFISFLNDKIKIGVKASFDTFFERNIVINDFKRLIGKEYDEVKDDETIFFSIIKGSNGEIRIPIVIFKEEHLLTPTQLLAMVLSKSKKNLKKAKECVMSCPIYFTDHQRRELINAASIANLKVLQLIPDTTAIALHYFHDRIVVEEKKNEIIAFIDIGSSSLQCSIVNYDGKKKSFDILAVDYDDNLGGILFTKVIFDHFVQKYKLNLNNFSKSLLWNYCDDIKVMMSDLDFLLPIKIPNLFENEDFSCSMDRKEFEELSEKLFNRIENFLNQVLKKLKAKLGSDFIVEKVGLLGGCSLIPAVQERIQKVFNIKSFILFDHSFILANCCATKSFFIKNENNSTPEIKYNDYQPYQINVSYFHKNSLELKKYSISALFKKGCSFPLTKQIKLTTHELPMIFNFNYIDDKNEIRQLGEFEIFSKEKLSFEKTKMLVKVRLDESGLLQFLSAQLEIKENNSEDLKMLNQTKTKIIDLEHKIVNLKGFLTDENLKKLKKINIGFIVKNKAENTNLKKELTNLVEIWKKRINQKYYYRFLDLQQKEDFIRDLNGVHQVLSNKNDLPSRELYLFSKYNDLKEIVDLIYDEINKEISEKDLPYTYLEVITTLKSLQKNLEFSNLLDLKKTYFWAKAFLPVYEKTFPKTIDESTALSEDRCFYLSHKLQNELNNSLKNFELAVKNIYPGFF